MLEYIQQSAAAGEYAPLLSLPLLGLALIVSVIGIWKTK